MTASAQTTPDAQITHRIYWRNVSLNKDPFHHRDFYGVKHGMEILDVTQTQANIMQRIQMEENPRL